MYICVYVYVYEKSTHNHTQHALKTSEDFFSSSQQQITIILLNYHWTSFWFEPLHKGTTDVLKENKDKLIIIALPASLSKLLFYSTRTLLLRSRLVLEKNYFKEVYKPLKSLSNCYRYIYLVCMQSERKSSLAHMNSVLIILCARRSMLYNKKVIDRRIIVDK